MSGRDLRTFVTSHRVYSNANEPEALVRRVNDGLGSNKYSSVDYEKLRAMAAEKKFSSHKSLIKMKKIEQISKQSKENNTLKQHKMVWQQEFARLLSQRKRLQAEMDVLSRACLLDSTCAGIFQDLEDFESFLSSDFARFKEDTATPVWALREDLQFWLTENQAELRNGTPAAVDKHAEIRCTVDNVRQQQQVILDRLHHDQLALEQELKTGSLGELFTTHGKEARLPREQGIPEEAFDLECHDPEFKASVIQEFILIDQRHLERLSRLEEQHEAVLREDENGGWSPEDHFVFQAVHEQYAPDLPNRRALLLDRLAKHLPCKTRFHVLEHERWWLGYKYYCSRHRSILHDWQRDRREMMTKAKLVFAESCVTHSLNMALGDCRQKQKDLCKSLYEKVCRWREQKEEALRLEARIEDRRRAEALEQEMREVEREKKRRRADKEKIVGYRDDLAKQKAQAEEEELRKLEEMQRLLAEQAEYDRERVKYREEMVHRKGEERRMREEEREREQEERERRLEALREQVRVVAETDPARLARNTEAWRNRLLGEEADVELQKPLFNVHTFTEKQVTADPRVRLEAKLREVGLMQTDYARHVMSQVKPAHQPRRDTESTIFKLDR